MITSPCTKRCRIIDNTCQGCGRSLDDISKWKYYSKEEKEYIKTKASLVAAKLNAKPDPV